MRRGVRLRMVDRAAVCAAALAMLAGCGTLPKFRSPACLATAPIPPDGAGERSATLDVLTYNIEGLPWPVRKGRGPSLDAIGEKLRALQANGDAPDIVLFQEAFSRRAVSSVVAAGYSAVASGPGRLRRSHYSVDTALPGRSRPAKGELGIRLTTSGLIIASRYPITSIVTDAYSRKACAGFDCLSNKGAMLASIVVPGVPDAISIANTHMNARYASKVAPARNLAAHRAQSRELQAFLTAQHDGARPLILGGDFNMRRSPERFERFGLNGPLTHVHGYCLGNEACDVRMSWDGDAPWMDTQDLQFFLSGTRVRVTPIRVEAMFDGSPDSPKLSDHDGFRVVYRLSWTGDAPPAAACRPVR